jgi:nitroreductase
MGHTLDEQALNALFRDARTHTKWQPRPVTDDTLRSLYDELKWAPTGMARLFADNPEWWRRPRSGIPACRAHI